MSKRSENGYIGDHTVVSYLQENGLDAYKWHREIWLTADVEEFSPQSQTHMLYTIASHNTRDVSRLREGKRKEGL